MGNKQKIRARLRLRLAVALPVLLSLFMMISVGLVMLVLPGVLVPGKMNADAYRQSIGLSILLMIGLAFVGNLLAALYISRHLHNFMLKIDSSMGAASSLKPGFAASSEIGALGVMLDQATITLSRFVNDSYIIDNLPEAVIMVDSRGKIMRVNGNAARLLSARAEECAGRNVRDFIPDTFMNQGLYRMIDEALQGKVVDLRAVNCSLLENHGGRYWVSVHPVRKDGLPPREVSISIKDQASIEAVRNQIRRIEQLAAIGSMASTIAHEVRNPLGAIRTFTELIQEGLPEDSAKAGYAEEILRQIQRLDRVIEDTLAFSRDSVTTVKDVDLAELLSRTVALARYKFKVKPLPVDEKYDPGLPTVRGDPEKLSQAFLNLIINSFEACREKGRIAVSAERAGSHRNANGNTLCVSISDSGVGIPPENMKRLFEPFFTTKPDGTGLGLATAHNILTAHGGLIEVDSQPGEGATFQVFLPEKHHFCDLQTDDRWSFTSHA